MYHFRKNIIHFEFTGSRTLSKKAELTPLQPRPFTITKHQNMTKQCKTVERPLSDTNWTSFLSHKSISWSLQIPDIYRLVLKEKQLHRSKHSHVPTFFRHVAVMKLKMSRCFSKIFNILCFSSSVMSKIWVYEISKSFHSLFYTSCSVQTFSELFLYFVGFLLFVP